jgi:hypothetical protein
MSSASRYRGAMRRTWVDVIAAIGFGIFGVCLVLASPVTIFFAVCQPIWWLAPVVMIPLAYTAFRASRASLGRPTSGFNPALLAAICIAVLAGALIMPRWVACA